MASTAQTKLKGTVCECGCGALATVGKRFIKNHDKKISNRKPDTTTRYLTIEGERVWAYRLRAEQALGKPLPSGAVVHHADGNHIDTAPLVICPDQAYHMLLHARMRIVQAGGHPDRDGVCDRCHMVKPRSDFSLKAKHWNGIDELCRECKSAYQRAQYAAQAGRTIRPWRRRRCQTQT